MAAVGFYHSPRWRALRLVALRRDRWRCTICGVSVSAKGQARVDHIHPRTTHPHLELALDNLRTLCPRCDNQRHWEKGLHSPKRQPFNVRGEPLDPNHHWYR